ncbi:MAG: hypothetical protein WDM88_13220 [Galbitalea sp.]
MSISADEQNEIEEIVIRIQAGQHGADIGPHVDGILRRCRQLVASNPDLIAFVGTAERTASTQALREWSRGKVGSVAASPWNRLADGLGEILQ